MEERGEAQEGRRGKGGGERERKEMGEVQLLDSRTLLGGAIWGHNFCAKLRIYGAITAPMMVSGIKNEQEVKCRSLFINKRGSCNYALRE